MYHLRRRQLVPRRFRRRKVKQQNTAGSLPHTSSSRWPSKPWVQLTPPLVTSSARSDGASRPSVEMGAKHHFSISDCQLQSSDTTLWLSPVPSPLRWATRPDQPDNTPNKLIMSKSLGEQSTSGQKK